VPLLAVDVDQVDDGGHVVEAGQVEILDRARAKRHDGVEAGFPGPPAEHPPQPRRPEQALGCRAAPHERPRAARPPRPAAKRHRRDPAAPALQHAHRLARRRLVGQEGERDVGPGGQEIEQAEGTDAVAAVGRIGHPVDEQQDLRPRRAGRLSAGGFQGVGRGVDAPLAAEPALRGPAVRPK
jgi:hypothetical protein